VSHPVTRGERDIHQGGVIGYGEGDRSGDEKKGEIRYIYKHRL
jgi:hypothetical protein